MDVIVKLYEAGQYLECRRQLDNFKTSTLIEEFIVQNNILASKFQDAYVQENDVLRKTVSEEFLKLWSKVLTLPNKKEFCLLTLTCACNVIYSLVSLLNSKLSAEDLSITATQTGYQALEKVASTHQVFIYQENNSHADKFVLLVCQLLQCQKAQPNELSLVLYSCVLLCLIKIDSKFVQLVLNILKNVESSKVVEKTAIFNYVFLLSPYQMSGGVISCCSNIVDFTRVFLFLFYCINSSWSEALAMNELAENSQLFDVWKFLKIYAEFHLPNLENSSSVDVENLTSDGKMSFLSFATCLINAAKFASKNKPFIALKFLNFAIAGEIAQTEACAIVMICAATQFEVLREPEFSIEALRIAEESLLKNLAFDGSFHTDLSKFLLIQLKLFRLPALSSIIFQLARTFLKNQRYKEAVVEYEKLSACASQHQDEPFSEAFKLPSPSTSIILHEHILALILANDCEKALDIIQSSLEEDFLLLFLHAEALLMLKQHKKAIRLMNRSIAKLNSSNFPVTGTLEMIKSKFHFRLAQLFDEIGNTKDAFHQLKFSVQHGAMDSNMKKFCEQFTRKLGIEKEFPVISDIQSEAMIMRILEHSNDLAFRYAILNHII